jgi:hypothetical protein
MESKFRLIILMVAFSFCNRAFSEPMFIYFNEMISRTSIIAIGTYIGCNGKTPDESMTYYFKVDQYLKSSKTHTSDTLALGRAYGAVYLQPGTKYVAFINQSGGFEWVGITKDEKISDQSMLFIEGFYDWNAYIVSPACLSVGQLKNYIRDETYSGSVYGDLHFFSNSTKKMEASAINIEVKYTYKNNEVISEVLVNGTQLNDFNKIPAFGLPWHYEEVTIEYESNLYRPLEIKGKLLNLHPSSTRWHAYFWVEEPEEVTYDEFQEFLRDSKNGHPYYELEVKMDNSKVYTVIIHDEIGRVGKLIGYSTTPLPISSLSTAPEREIVFEDGEKEIVLTLDSCLVDKTAFEFAGDDLVRELKIAPAQGKVVIKTKGTELRVGTCTVSYKATRFARD